MDKKITPNKIIAFYFAIPIILGMLLSNILGLDASGFMKEYIGILRFLEATGEEIRTKSMILLVAFIFSPLAWLYLNQLQKSNKAKKARNDMSAKSIFFSLIIGGSIIGIMIFYLFFIHEPSIQSIEYPNRGMRLFTIIITSNILFSLFCSAIIMAFILAVLAVPLGIKELIVKFNK